jgi:hypothetical protein
MFRYADLPSAFGGLMGSIHERHSPSDNVGFADALIFCNALQQIVQLLGYVDS